MDCEARNRSEFYRRIELAESTEKAQYRWERGITLQDQETSRSFGVGRYQERVLYSRCETEDIESKFGHTHSGTYR